jgi:O-antigen/teichoic acid export membrane protein
VGERATRLEAASMSKNGSTRRSLVFSFLDRYASLVVAVLSSMILARLLTPVEVGVFSVTMVIISLVSTVRDLGAGQYLVQEKELTTDRIRAVWTVQLTLGVLMGTVVLIASHPMATFYGDPRMRDIMWVLAFNYLINPFGSVTYAWLMREMRYDAIALIRFSSTLGGTVVSVVLAMRGHGPISLAFGSLASTVVNAAMAVPFRPVGYPWMPGTAELRRVLSFGTMVTTASMVNTFSKGAPEFFVGKLQGLTAAGLYSRSNGLIAMFHRLVSDAVYSVAFSMFSKESRERGNFDDSFLRATSYVTAMGWSFSLTVILLAHPITRVLYGPQWDASVDLTRVLSVGAAFTVPLSIWYAALLASGAQVSLVKATFSSSLSTVLLAGAGAAFGLVPLSWAIVIASAVSAGSWMLFLRRHLSFQWRRLGVMLAHSGLVAVGAAVVPALLFISFGPRPEHNALVLAIGVPGSVVGFGVAARWSRHPLNVELERLASRLKILWEKTR